ncbi:MAG: hypothetical protein GX616_01830 [Planctomycetes bacterium]|nr:hypothetical protein [Planctomycetota bacterium]
MLTKTLLAILDGSTYANAAMPWGKPGPIRLPDDPGERRALVEAHVHGRPADVLYCPRGAEPERRHVDKLELAAFCPRSDGRCSWLGTDLDGPSHGPAGLQDPAHAARVIAGAAEAAGLSTGLLVAQSRSGVGRHLFLILPEPVTLPDGVVAMAALIWQALRLAAADVADYDAPHAFRRVDGAIAKPGEAGGLELYPRSTARPERGWALVLPTANQLVGAFDGRPAEFTHVPVVDSWHWARFLREAKARAQTVAATRAKPVPRRKYSTRDGDPLTRIDLRTREFLAGAVEPGSRNARCFAATCDLIGRGVSEGEAERLILQAASSCGLGEREARVAFSSAVGTLRKRGR